MRRRTTVLGLALAVGLVPLLAATTTASGASAPAPQTTAAATDPLDAAGPAFRALDGFRLGEGPRVRVEPRAFAAFRLDRSVAASGLAEVGSEARRFAIPAPDGNLEVFDIVEDSILAPGLQARHPEIRTYAGRSTTDPRRTVRLDLTPLGFHASVRGPGGAGSWYVDPAYDRVGASTHLSYYRAAVPARGADLVESELLTRAARTARSQRTSTPGAPVVKHTYRLAFTTDPTYADYWGSANVLAAKTTLMNRVNQIYNDDLAVKFVLIEQSEATNFDTKAKAIEPNGPCGADPCYSAAAFYPDGTADDRPDGCTSELLSENTFALGQVVGADKFDIGHIGLGVNGGGIAGLGVVGASRKAEGCTGLDKPQGDFFAIDYVAHEIGHQMGGNHTFNGTEGSCAANISGVAVEPGSGSSVMAYAGICGVDDLQAHTDPYFSQKSIDEITATILEAPSAVDERQTVTLRGFDAGDRFELTYGTESVVITNTPTTYNSLALANAIQTISGEFAEVTGYNGATTPGAAGFTMDFSTISSGVPVQRFGVRPVLAGGEVTGFVGTQVDGGDSTNAGTTTTLANRAPSVVAPEDRTIPVQTPFALTGSASDADGDALTYLWEQNDLGAFAGGTSLVDNTKTNGPLFRVFGVRQTVTEEGTFESPSPGLNIADGSPSRTFPDLTQILAGNTNAATGACPEPPADAAEPVPPAVVDCFSEFLPTPDYAAGDPITGGTGTLDFRLTARDAVPTGGGTAFDDVTLTVDTEAGPFLVTSRAQKGAPVKGGAVETITWDVAGTEIEGLAPNVKISLSYDGGLTFPKVLAETTPNDGTEAVTFPDVGTKTARIKIEAVDNYFFDVNDADFEIDGASGSSGLRTTITDGPRDGFVLSRSTRFGFKASRDGAVFECRLDGQAVPCADGRAQLRKLDPGSHVFTVAAEMEGGPRDATPAKRRFAVPLPADRLERAKGLWNLRSDSGAFFGEYLTTSRSGNVLSAEVDRMVKLGIVVGRAPDDGRVRVLLDGRRIATLDLSGRTDERVLVDLESFRRPTSGEIRLVTLDDRPVRIEGLGVLSR